jgi:ADP-ribose pyrophosphatase YjhB (NUDIX family)
MKLKDYKKTVSFPLRKSTLVFLVKGDEVLLAMKKRGFGEGRWNGVGGKVTDGETVEEAAKREAKEEIGVDVKSLQKVASLNFFFPHVPTELRYNQEVCVFLVVEWEGEPRESEEMKPQWHTMDSLPFENMWADDPLWLPRVLNGKKVQADFSFTEDQKVEECIFGKFE